MIMSLDWRVMAIAPWGMLRTQRDDETVSRSPAV
jgi:hypothetical protein